MPAAIFEVGLNEGDYDAIAAVTAEDFIDHHMHVETGSRGREDLRQALIDIERAFRIST